MTSTREQKQDSGQSARKMVESSRLFVIGQSARSAMESSRLFAVGQSARSATASSRLVAAGHAVGDWLRGSFLYRWLTKEPEPEVIVIDLRETATVGPFIALLDRATAWLGPWWRTSGCRRLCVRTAAGLSAQPVRALGLAVMAAATVGFIVTAAGGNPSTGTLVALLYLSAAGALATRSRDSWRDVQETRVYQMLTAALEPPEPPAEAGEPDESATDTTDRSETRHDDTAESDRQN